jgi:addiction module HigA family antidote
MISGECASCGLKTALPKSKLPTIISKEIAMTDFESSGPEDIIPPIHPGVFLEEILVELEISHEELAAAIEVATGSVTAIVKGHSPITGDMAMRIGKALWMSPETWLNLQKMYELEVAKISTDTSSIVPLMPPPDESLLQAPAAEYISL